MPLAPPRPLDPRLFDVHEHNLENGLSVRMLVDDTVPAISLYTFFRVGSRNERPGITGIAHLFEHMMFNGAQKYGPKEFDRLLESSGGHSNAYTSHDVTAYFEDFASEALDLVLDLESDRMRSLALAPEILASEREIVKEERRLSVENEILGLLDEELFALAFEAHPYRWPVIGWMGDLEVITRDDCLEFFKTYYSPSNASLWMVGNFDPGAVLKSIERYYGDISRGPQLPARASTEPPQRGERRSEVLYPAHAEAMAIGFKAPRGSSIDAIVLDVIQFAISAGEGGRLVKTLVYEKLIAANVIVDFSWRADPGLFVILVELNPGVPANKALSVIETELARVAEHGLDEKELLRAKGQLRSQLLREIATNNGRAHTLGTHELISGSWRTALAMAERYAAVTNEEVRNVAASIFAKSTRSVVTLVPTPFSHSNHTDSRKADV